ncbi:MAG: hypothetical protein HQK75_11150 [Candidatus Magnetomorum sp.]|nr:hypothetical protein [Candidatus Magnetomorum sp.]
MKNKPGQYTCKDYQSEMILISLNRKLADHQLSDKERQDIKKEINKMEKEMGMI